MTSAQIRQSFLDFFHSKPRQHTIVPSSSLMPDAPNLLFTNAGMNQFVPIFLGERKADVTRWANAVPSLDTRAADTQKCIRAGGKHNDLEDVGLDTYHHTFFEMLGNWSFGDYFKREAIEWAWELVTEVWKFPKERLYATVYKPGEGDPASFDQEAYDLWAGIFTKAGLDPKVHIVFGNKKDNFWMMGETGPCGPCSEIHVDLTPNGDTGGSLVNKGDARCIEIWNLVFIQFNANPDGTFSPLPAKHVDTGMGFERVTSIMQCTKGFTNFAATISNYETDIFRPIFDKLEQMSGRKYCSTLPRVPGSATVPVASVSVPPTESERGAAASASAELTSHALGAAARDAQQSDRDGRAPQPTYYKRRLPHFERPWAKYMVSFTTRERRQLSPQARDIVLKSLLFGHEQRRYQLYAACVLPDHVHFLFEPQIKEQDKEGKPVFWSLTELMHSIKSFTAHEINKAEKQSGQVWENESFDRLIRGDADLEEKFHYICRNPWDSGVVPPTENYSWLWTPDAPVARGSATVPVASVSVPPTESVRVAAASASAESTSHALGAVARDAQQCDRDGRAPHSQEQIQIDVAFRVIADHIRTLSFAIADGIQPGNNDRNYVLRRILRRAVRYGRTLGFHKPFFYELVDVLVDTMGDVFPEIRARKEHVKEVIRVEEEAFNKTLDQGLWIFEEIIRQQEVMRKKVEDIEPRMTDLMTRIQSLPDAKTKGDRRTEKLETSYAEMHVKLLEGVLSDAFTDKDFKESGLRAFTGPIQDLLAVLKPLRMLVSKLTDAKGSEEYFFSAREEIGATVPQVLQRLRDLYQLPIRVTGWAAFVLYDTYGFPLDLTELMARERGLTVDVDGFNKLMEEQRDRARKAQKKQVIELSQIESTTPTAFVGYDKLETAAKVVEVVELKDKTAVILDTSVCYAEMGGQVGDTGELEHGSQLWRVTNTQKAGNTWLHFIEEGSAGVSPALVGVPPTSPAALDAQRSDRDGRAPRAETVALPFVGSEVTLSVDQSRRRAIERHHTVTHIFHWALHEVVNRDATQKGSFVGPEKLTFDFNCAPLTPQQVADIEKLVNERILENAIVSWSEVPYTDVCKRADVMQLFGEKYGDTVRVVQIGGGAGELNGYSMELCGGTHTRHTGEIGLFRIVSESAIAAGVRRVEAVAGLEAWRRAGEELELLKRVSGRVNSPLNELEKKIEAMLAHQKELEKALKAAKQRDAAQSAKSLIASAETIKGVQVIATNLGEADGDTLQTVADALKGDFKGIVVLGGLSNGAVALVATVSPEITKQFQAGKIIQAIAPIVGGKGGGRPDNARGGGKDASKLEEALAKAKSLLG